MQPHLMDSQHPANDNRIRSIAVVGGGTAGWMAASILARALPGAGCTIHVIESPDIPTVGVGEATIPPVIDLLRFLSINESDFVRHTQSTYKLGIKFTNWLKTGHSYWHPFGTFGESINLRPFFHAWHKARADGLALQLGDFSLCAALGDAGKFRFPDRSSTPAAGLRYALQFDASLVAQYLRAYSERLGVKRLERTVASATQRTDGAIDELVFADNTRLRADLYIDCSGFRGLLIERTLQVGYQDWRELLPCDRAVAAQSESQTPRPPYTESIATGGGWRWRIPLRHRVGNGHVYSSDHVSDNTALDELLAGVRGKVLTDPRVLRFVAGRRNVFWRHNCVAIGLASGFLEPLESTSIHLITSSVYKLLEFFPDRSFEPSATAAYNAELSNEMERIRDFIVLHYCLTERDDTDFWRHCRTMNLPDSLHERIELYRSSGRIRPKSGDLFTDISWFYIFEGMNVQPIRTDPLMDVVSGKQLHDILLSMSGAVSTALQEARSHDSFLSDTTASPAERARLVETHR